MSKKFNINNCLFYSNPEEYYKIEKLANKQSSRFKLPRTNLLKSYIKSFAKEKRVYLQILYLPFNDVQVWGMFYQLNGIYFIVINSEISINKQNVALIHEFYHFYTSVNEFYEQPDIIKENSHELNNEDKKANAFAASFLMPAINIKSFLIDYKMNNLENKIIAIKDIMDAFVVPFKTTIIRLMELKILDIEEGLLLLNKDKSIENLLKLYNVYENESTRWGYRTERPYMEFDQLEFLMIYNKYNEIMPSKQMKKHEEIVKKIMCELRNKH